MPLGWMGAGGQPLQEICDQINTFTSQHSELIILELSHAVVGDIPNALDLNPIHRFQPQPAPIVGMNQSQYNDLFRFLSTRVKSLYVCPDPHADLTTLPMSDFLGSGGAAVIFALSDDGITIPYENLGKGFCYGMLTTDKDRIGVAAAAGRRPQLYYNGGYSNNNDASLVQHDQFDKLATYRNDDWLPPFLLEFTLTDQIPTGLNQKSASDVLTLATVNLQEGAALVRPKLINGLPGKATREMYSTMIGVDFFASDVTNLALQINTSLSRPLTDKWRYEVLTAFWGPKDVTTAIQADFGKWQMKDNDTLNPHSTGPYRFSVTPLNPVLGADPAVGVPKQLMVLMRRYHILDDCLSYTVQYSAKDFEELVIDTAEMSLSKSLAQRAQTNTNCQQTGWPEMGVAYAMYGPIDPRACSTNPQGRQTPIVPNRCINEVLKAIGPAGLSSKTATSFTVNFAGIFNATVPSQLRVLVYQRCKTQTMQYNWVNTTTYRLYTTLEGQTMTISTFL